MLGSCLIHCSWPSRPCNYSTDNWTAEIERGHSNLACCPPTCCMSTVLSPSNLYQQYWSLKQQTKHVTATFYATHLLHQHRVVPFKGLEDVVV